ncbi:hypothetical protein RSAG8_13116, partial [Rhizoctonia solani AG-8 WAC10335]
HKGNTISALDCLVNERGEALGLSSASGLSFRYSSATWSGHSKFQVPVVIDGAVHDTYMHDAWLGIFLQFYGIADGLCTDATSTTLKEGKVTAAKTRLGKYLSSCPG